MLVCSCVGVGTVLHSHQHSTFRFDVSTQQNPTSLREKLERLELVNAQLNDDIHNAQTVATRTAEKLNECGENLSTAIKTIVELRRELARVSEERARLFAHVVSHANCCTAEGNTEFASKVARGVK